MAARSIGRVLAIGVAVVALLGGCSSDGSDGAAPGDDPTSTTAADGGPTTEGAGAGADETTTTAEPTDDAGATDVAALCDASADTADLDARQGMLDALTDAWLDKELLTELDGGETISFLGCADGRAEAVHRLPSGTQELLVFTVGDEVTVDVAQDPATACAAAETSESARSALAC
ncbi:MAG: hypothetical protein R2746_16845 [Acidimicrobiales bacterium]